MEQMYKISTRTNIHCTRQTLLGASGRSTLRLLMTICLLGLLVQVSARPSDATSTKSPVTITNDHHASPVSAPHHHSHKRRSVEDPDEYDEQYYQTYKRCYEDEDVNELCQRCSKVTKSEIVFKMCCSNEDQTMDWCKAYVYYGIQT